MRLLFERDLTPHPQYIAFYKWLQSDKGFGANAVVHFGMHGTVEWLPGSPLGNTGLSWSDVLLGPMPNVYVYAANNPSESIVAKRRGYGTIVSYNVPPYGRSGLYKQLADLRALLQARSISLRRRSPSLALCRSRCVHSCAMRRTAASLFVRSRAVLYADGPAPRVRSRISARTRPAAPRRRSGHPSQASCPPAASGRTCRSLRGRLRLSPPKRWRRSLRRRFPSLQLGCTSILGSSRIACSPRVCTRWAGTRTPKKCEATSRRTSGGTSQMRLSGRWRLGRGARRRWRRLSGRTPLQPRERPCPLSTRRDDETASQSLAPTLSDSSFPSSIDLLTPCLRLYPVFPQEAAAARLPEAEEIVAKLSRTTEELDGFCRALRGEYILPEAGGDLLRDGPGVLPTGRNIHALDPYRMPSPAAFERGAQAGQAILEQHRAANSGAYPETVSVNLWGLDAIKTKGESVALALYLVGAQSPLNHPSR